MKMVLKLRFWTVLAVCSSICSVPAGFTALLRHCLFCNIRGFLILLFVLRSRLL